MVGLAGAATAAVWFILYDLGAGTPFRTPALVGAALFKGLRDPAALTVTPGLVLEYAAVHGLAFLVFGWAAAGLLALTDRDRHALFGVFILFCCFEVAALTAVEVLAPWLLETLHPWAIIGGNFVAALVMLGILMGNLRVSAEEVLTSAD